MSGRFITLVGQGGIQTDLDLDDLGQEAIASVIPDLLVDHGVGCKDWLAIASEHWRQGRYHRTREILDRGITYFKDGRKPDYTALVSIHSMYAHLHLHLARSAPRVILSNTKYDKLDPSTQTKDFYHKEAAANLNAAANASAALGADLEEQPVTLIMGRVIHHLATGQPNLAHPLVETLLQRQPENLLALAAQARLQFARRSHEQSIQTYQKLLSLSPDMSPDPRIGLGLCAWQLGDKIRARAAWNRALEREPTSWVCLLLLGLASLNNAREPSVSRSERVKLETEGVGYVQKAFKLNSKSSASALALASISGHGGQVPLASKLAERAIQYADNKLHSINASAERGRLGFVAGDLADAGTYIATVKKDDPNATNIPAELALGQIAIKSGNLREALNYIEQTAKKLNGKGPLEYTVLHACLLAYPHPGMPHDEVVRNKQTARNMLKEVHNLVVNAETEEDWARLRGIGSDVDVFVDLARLWQSESFDMAIESYQTALSTIADHDLETDSIDPAPPSLKSIRLSNNLGALYHLQGNVETAEAMYQEALQKVAGQSGEEIEVLKTILAYNLGRAYEEGGDNVKAAQWYRDVLRQHPEHLESKARLAFIASSAGRHFDAHTLLKECLQSDEANIVIRAVYTNFLISIGSIKEAYAFTTQTLKYDKNDAWTFCALGWLHFTLGREAKGGQELAERTKQYLRSAEAYERALHIDPTCAMAAQGLAIAMVEDSLAPKGTSYGADELKVKSRLAGQTLGVFGRIKDSLAEGAINVNMGHCYFVRGEEEKAIESYDTASNAFKGQNVSVLLYLSRAWYALANRESNFSAMAKALHYCQVAMHIQPSDRAILYNIAMIQQKAAEMLFSLEPSKRTLEELQQGLEQAKQAASTFRTLADDKFGPLPYDADLADQRARYGDGLLRRAPGEMARQEAYEGEAQARANEARRLRAEEQAKIKAAEEARQIELRTKAAQLAEERRRAQEEAMAWQEELAARQAEEESRRAANAEKRKRKKEGVVDSDDEQVNGQGQGETRRKEKKPRKKKTTTAKAGSSRKHGSKSEIVTSDEEKVNENSDDDEENQVVGRKKSRSRKYRSRSEVETSEEEKLDEDNQVAKGGSRNFGSKKYLSKAEISTSDEETMDENEVKESGIVADARSNIDLESD
ncbi:uncharacterized protein L203_104236 [Cryptococcus depauperatus CBS 7841]|uniref:Uncharacterized protein n=1 Tax=Cryptococcus depauperatus CBS 7841 TaxID=1295531 RepID=A0A1E3I5A9_9TREE|nr:RNA polymerase-associated protein CTR9 [Cryptococcus depauperatus CBS 7841]